VNAGEGDLEWALRTEPIPAGSGPRGWGGPDDFGYQWIDSDEPGGPEFVWDDISDDGTEIFLGDDEGAFVALPFSFPFYGSEKHTMWISSNGYLTFGSFMADYTNDPIPDPSHPNDIIAPMWDDLNPAYHGAIHYRPDAWANSFTVQYTEVARLEDVAVGYYTFQVILKRDGTILFQYLDMTEVYHSATTGIENADGTIGLEVAYNEPYVHNELAVEIGIPVPWLRAGPSSGVLPPGGEFMVEVCANSEGVEPGHVYQAFIHISSNDPESPEVYVPVTLTVLPTGVETALTEPVLRGIFPNPFNPRTQIAYDLPAPARVSLDVYSASGRRVRTLVDDAPRDAGSHAALWDGTDANGNRVASGVYLCRLEVDGETITKKMLLAK